AAGARRPLPRRLRPADRRGHDALAGSRRADPGRFHRADARLLPGRQAGAALRAAGRPRRGGPDPRLHGAGRLREGGTRGGGRLAPALVVRAAAWPLERLAPFGDEALADLAATASSADPAGWQRYAAAYERVLACESEQLWRTTVGDPAFFKALTLA